jgi:hypothetical protein
MQNARYFVRFKLQVNLGRVDTFLYNSQISNFVRIHLVIFQISHVDLWTGMAELTVAFWQRFFRNAKRKVYVLAGIIRQSSNTWPATLLKTTVLWGMATCSLMAWIYESTRHHILERRWEFQMSHSHLIDNLSRFIYRIKHFKTYGCFTFYAVSTCFNTKQYLRNPVLCHYYAIGHE